MKNNLYAWLVISFTLVWFYSTSLLAQETPKSSPETELSSESDPTEAEKTNPYNVVLGSFLFRPELAISERYDSNIFALRDDEIEDTLLIIEPSFLLLSNWKDHLLKLGIGGEAGRYHEYSTEDYDDYWMDLQGRYDFSGTTNVFGGVNHTRDHEENGTPSVVGTLPTSFDSDQAHAGFAHRSGSYRFRLGGTFEQLDYDDSGPINNDDRDREVYGLGFRASYLYSPNREVFVQAISDERDYNTDVDDNGFERDSSGHRLAIGLKGRYSNRLSAETYLGQMYQEFDDSRFDDVDTATFYTKIGYLSSARSRFNLVLDQSLEETTLANASSYLSSTLSLQGLRQLSDHNTLTATFSAGIADYQDVELEEDIYSASFEWRHRLTPEFYMALDYSLLLNDSNESIDVGNAANPQYQEDYVRQQVMLTFSSTLFNVDDPDFGKTPLWETLDTSKNNWGGFYLGGKAGHGATQVRTSGTRGEGTDTAEFSNTGPSAGLFAGIGINRNRWYLGLEVEADQADQDILHTKDKAGSLSIQVDHAESHAVNLRGGRVVKSGSLFYARVGKAYSDFDTQYSLNSEPDNAVDKTFDVDGTRYGVGADIPIGDSVFLRMDYAYTKYHGYEVDASTTTEKFKPVDSLFNLGLGWLFGGQGKQANVNPDISLNGFYAGMQLGHGSLNSSLDGTHMDGGSSPGTYEFTGDFGDTGYSSGFFAGIGQSQDSLYLGLEVEVEGSNFEWEHNRDPRGRDFGVEKKSDVGLGIRAGYQLGNGTLLYVSGSRVRARFVTDWEKGENSSNYISRDDKVYGNRVSIGADIPTSRSVFLRVSYAHTDYDAYDFTTEHAMADDMTFENSESQFRLGLGAHF